jgi:DNA-binding transcriptional regulator YdaS (Cro superfamily)
MRWLAEHDPRYLSAFYAFLDAPTRQEKLALYERLVEQTVAPFGAVWPEEATAIQLADGSEVTSEQIEQALQWWEHIVE